MKYLICPPIFLLLLPVAAHAQGTSTAATGQFVNAESLLAKNMAVKLRCTSVVNLEYKNGSFIVEDSSVCKYSGNRSGLFNKRLNDWEWDVDEEVKYEASSGEKEMYPSEKFKIVRNSEGQAISKVVSFNEFSDGWSTGVRILFFYRPEGFDQVTQYYNSDSSKWTSREKMQVAYNATGDYASIVYEEWDKEEAAWKETTRFVFTYNLQGVLQLVDVDYSVYYYGPDYRMSYTYDDAGNRTLEVRENKLGDAWEETVRELYSDFVAGQPRTTIIQYKQKNYQRVNITYNAYGRPETYMSQYWNDTAGKWENRCGDRASRMHYEVYTGADAIPGPDELEIVPVPAVNIINLKINWKEPQNTTVNIADVQGRVYRSWKIPLVQIHNEVLSIDDLPAGNYIVTITGATNTVCKKLTVVR